MNYEFDAKLATLVMMYSFWETEPQNKLIVNLHSSSIGLLVECCIGLSIFGKAVNNQQHVFVPACALVQL